VSFRASASIFAAPRMRRLLQETSKDRGFRPIPANSGPIAHAALASRGRVLKNGRPFASLRAAFQWWL